MVEKQGTCITIQCRHAVSSSRAAMENMHGSMDGWMVLHVPIFSTEHKLSHSHQRMHACPWPAATSISSRPSQLRLAVPHIARQHAVLLTLKAKRICVLVCLLHLLFALYVFLGALWFFSAIF
ncbi:hypothetical protein HU200_024892 [Digitaria exilis]|uniref:Uncharacterized protein n=1 Tax=Digitaria exilis TaxID=1010633 RepID=A0A835DVL5_9POAL|nr:hypothetical protein HU200_062768 [Digitaria exilis]KAF8720111.1 hypothetical protein HU200_024892 [Digitaria exilis]